MRANLESRIAKLEQARESSDVCFVARLTPDGRRIPSKPGARLAPYCAVLPEVCATTGKWFRQYALPAIQRVAGGQTTGNYAPSISTNARGK